MGDQGNVVPITTLRLRILPMPPAEARRLVHGLPTQAPCAPDYPGDLALVGAAMVVIASAHGEDLGPFGWYQIHRRADGRIVGDCGFVGPPDGDGTVTIAYEVVASARAEQAGLAEEALRGLVAWAHSRSDVRAVLADSARANLPRRRVLEAAGLRAIDERDDVVLFST